MPKFNKNHVTVNISSLTIIKVVAVALLLYFVYLVRDIIAIVFVSLILTSAINPWVDWMQSKKIPRALGMVFIYLLMFTIVGLAVYLIIPPIIEQVNDLANNFPYYYDKLTSSFSTLKEYTAEHGLLNQVKNTLQGISDNLQSSAGNLFTTISGIFGGILSFFLVLVITFYMAVEENATKKIVWSIVPEQHQPYVMQLISRMQEKIGLWLRGQFILSLIIFGMFFLGLSILGVKYALTLALIAGLTEFVPYLGPTMASIPAIFLAFVQSPILGLSVIALYGIVQFIENNFIVPKVMQKVVGLNPVVSIVVLLIGFKIGGVVGAIMAIPATTALSVFVNDVFERKYSSSAVDN